MDLVSLLVLVIVFGLLFYIVGLIPMPQPFKVIGQVILALIMIVYLLDGAHLGHIRWIK